MSNIIAFSHIEKCAGTTLITAFRSLYGIHHFDVIPSSKDTMLLSEVDIQLALRLSPKLKSIAGHSLRVYLPWTSKHDFFWVTVLREPVARIISDYNYHCNVLGYSGDYADFLKLESRRNFLVKSICGDEDIDRAKFLLRSSFSLVGTVDKINCFMVELFNVTGARFDIYKKSKKNPTREKKINIGDLTESQMKMTLDACKLDIQLYEYLVENMIDESGCYVNNNKYSKSRAEIRPSLMKYIVGNIFRNFVYKPCCGYLPLKRHALPSYRKNN